MQKYGAYFAMFLHIIFIGIILGNSLRIGIPFLPERKIPLSFLDMCILIGGTIALIYLLYSIIKRKRIIIPPSFKLVIVWLILGVASSVVVNVSANLGYNRLIYSLGYPYRIICLVFISLFIINNIESFNNNYVNIPKTIAYYSLVLSIVGFVIYYKFPYLINLWDLLKRYGIYLPDPDPHIYRLVSTFFDPNFLGTFFVLSIIYLIHVVTTGSKKEKLINWIILLTIFRAFLLTFSRSAYLTLGIAIIALCIMEYSCVKRFSSMILLRNIVVLLGIIIVCLSIEQLLGGNTLSRITQRWDIITESQTIIEPSAAARIENWKVGLKIFYKHPIVGVGYNNYGNVVEYISQSVKESQLFGNDSSWILILATTGIVGLVIFLLTYAMVIIDLVKSYRSNLYELHIRMMSSSLAAYLIALIISTNFNNFLFYPPIMCQCFIMYALIYSKISNKKTC